MPKDRRRLAAAIAAVVVIALFGWVTLDRSRQSAEVDRLTDKLEAFRGDASAEIEQLETDNSVLSSALDEAVGARDELEATSAELSERLDEATARAESSEAIVERYGELVGPADQIQIMPDLLGGTVQEAEAFAQTAGAVLVVNTSDPINVIARPDTIIEQVPAAGTAVVPGAAIWVDVFEQTD